MLKNIPIKNELYGSYIQSKEPIIYSIKSIGFYILTYLLYKADGTNNLNITKANISDYLKIVDIRTVTKYLLLLKKNNLISCEEDIVKNNKNSLLEISLKQYTDIDGGYELIPSEIFINYKDTISDKGWLILCLLTKMANFNLGSGSGLAYANISRETISKQIGLDRKTVTIYTNILKKEKLIQIIPRKNILLSEEDHCYVSKIYKVPFKINTKKKS